MRLLALPIVLSAPALAQPCNPATLFAPQTEYGATGSPFGMAVADLNGDTLPDVAIADLGNTMAVLLNDGAGGFLAPATYATGGSRPEEIVAGDLDHDGDSDLVVLHQSSDNAAVFLNDGSGAFGAPTLVNVGDGPREGVLADMNNDADLDLVVALRVAGGTGRVAVLLGNGDGTFAAPTSASVGVETNSVCVGHFNADDNLDVALAYLGDGFSNTGGVRVFVGNGAGDLSSVQTISIAGAPYRILAADLDADGDDDLATANSGIYASEVGGDNVSVLLNLGGASFVTQPLYDVPDQPLSICAADFDGDADLDLVVTSEVSDNVSLLINNSNATFQSALPYPLPSANSPRDVSVIDINLDGAADIVVANSTFQSSVSVLANTCSAPAPLITGQPSSLVLDSGADAVFTVEVASQIPTPSFQWRRDGAPLADAGSVSGATTPTLTLSGVTPADAARYTVEVTSASGAATSQAAYLGVRPGCTADLALPFGTLDFSDVLAFLTEFGAGCP